MREIDPYTHEWGNNGYGGVGVCGTGAGVALTCVCLHHAIM